MRHCDGEILAAQALGEPIDAADAAHVASCEECGAAVRELRALSATLVDAGAVGPLMAPPPGLWAAIEAQVAAEDDATPGSVSMLSAVRHARHAESAATRREPSRMFRPWTLAAAAAVGVILGGVGVGFMLRDAAPESVLVAQAQLADLATEADAGTARVEQSPDGTEVLVIDTTAPEAVDGSLEVWLIDPDVVGMVSLGFLTGDHGEFEIPAGYDVVGFPIVDISVEPADGDPTHSGDSITRGILGA